MPEFDSLDAMRYTVRSLLIEPAPMPPISISNFLPVPSPRDILEQAQRTALDCGYVFTPPAHLRHLLEPDFAPIQEGLNALAESRGAHTWSNATAMSPLTLEDLQRARRQILESYPVVRTPDPLIEQMRGLQQQHEARQNAEYAAWRNRPCLTTPHYTQRAVTRDIVSDYPEREPETVIFCDCGHTFTISADTTANHAGLYPCIKCDLYHDLPTWDVTKQGDVA